MQFNLTGRNIEITPQLRQFTVDKFNPIKERYNQLLTSINVTFHLENVTHIAEATVHVSRGDFHARAESSDMYSAIDELIDKIKVQLKKHKEKNKDH